MKTIFRYPLSMWLLSTVELPAVAKIVSFGFQNDQPVMWVLLDTLQSFRERQFGIYATGAPLPESMDHVASVQHGEFVWHLMEKM